VLAALLLLEGCNKDPQTPGAAGQDRKQAVPVTVATAVNKDIPVQLKSFGTVEALATVSIKSQVGGTLTTAPFKEGQAVKQGDLLFTIDPNSYEAALKQAQANVIKDQAMAANARRQADHLSELLQKGAATRDEYDTARSSADSLAAAVLADQAAVETAKLQLGYCTIRSPINGVVGGLLINVGNLIKANDVPLITINQTRPIYVTFSVPQQHLRDIKKYMAADRLTVEAAPPTDPDHISHGVLDFVDNAVDTSTGTIRLKGLFPNDDGLLWPGEFVKVLLTLTTERDAVVVPSEAVMTGQSGQFTFVVKDDLTVQSRPVKVGRNLDGLTVIDEGIAAGEKVVTDGQLRLVQGAKIQLKPPNGQASSHPATKPGAAEASTITTIKASS